MLASWFSVAPVPIPRAKPTADNLAKRAAALRERLPSTYHVEVAAPFVVVAQGSDADAKRFANMVRLQIDRLQIDLGMRLPDHIIDVWLFADTRSYRTGARTLLDDWPRTLSGYYSPRRRAVVVNLESGLATLRHELVHPLMHATFPDAPAWVDEGVASFFERDLVGGDTVHRDTVHRDTVHRDTVQSAAGRDFKRLRRALSAGKLPSIAALTAGRNRDFYGDPRFLSYTHARYVMSFLNARGQLSHFLRALQARREDSTGFDTLLKASGCTSPAELQARWDAYVLSLYTPAAFSTIDSWP